ncbi:DUF2339 domain-containing protein [Vibrio cincinnatiensis]|uniref:DUF2339 domain-containing protein n=1 Tax=Vibrio cincinnatiensis TaxID=675 RepID=UPI0012AC68D4|nr:DUF2339 domain-containing protein [Vibrio cincinnatiensis]
MFTIFVVIIALFALFHGFKATSRISVLERKLSLLERELQTLRSLFFHNAEQASSCSMTEEVRDSASTLSLTQITSDPSPQNSFSNYDAATDLSSTTVASVSATVNEAQLSSFSISDEHVLEKPLKNLITNIKENWLVWVGALAMLVGSGYLMQVIGSQIKFSPLMRVMLALALSLAVVFVGEWLHRQEQKTPERAIRSKGFTYVPASITGAGLMGIYCTVIFAFIVYQMLSPTLSLWILAGVAMAGFALSRRQGPLMAVLGLIGGYSAPLWISSGEPNYYLLAGYITLISISATLLMQLMRQSWLSPSITLPHMVWMTIMIESIPEDRLFSWLLLYLSFTLYLIFLVPRMGWRLIPRYRHCQKWWSHSPVVISIIMVLMLLLSITNIPDMLPLQFIYFNLLVIAMVWLPALRKTWSLRIFLPTILTGTVAVFIIAIVSDAGASSPWRSIIWLALAMSIILIGMRVFCQALSDRSPFNIRLLLVLVPAISLSTLVYLHWFIPQYALLWACFTLGISGSYFLLARRFHSLASHCSAVVHGIVAGCLFVWLSNTWLTIAMAVQVFIMTVQIQTVRFPPANWAVKVAMGLLVIRLTLLPFISAWQPVESGHWLWGAVSYLPALFILSYARMRLRKVETALSCWFEGACLHVLLMTIFTQTHYWLTGQYGYLSYLDFTSAIIFANQTLVMGFIYSYRSQFAQSLTLVYQVYSYMLWGIFFGLVLLLNTIESPLWGERVSAQAIPIFNMLTLGWLLPACILMSAIVKGWPILRIPRQWVVITSATLAALWLGMSIRQFWQASSMTLFQPTSMAELFSYSIAGFVVGGGLTWRGAIYQVPALQRIGMAILAGAALKVFLWDVSSLDGFWRAVSFLGLGGSLIALGWLFQKLNRLTGQISES